MVDENLKQEKLNKMINYYQKGNFSSAERLAIEITKEFPNHQLAWKLLVVIYYEAGKLSDSLIASRQTVIIKPEDYQSHFYLGNILRKLDRISEAQESYKKVLALKPNFEGAYINLGIISEADGCFEDAEKLYKKAISLKSDNPITHYNLGNVFKKLNQFKDAEKSFKKAISLKPKYPEAFYNLGNILISLNDRNKAIIAYTKAIELRPNFANSYLKLGNIYQSAGLIDLSEENFRKAIIYDKNLADAYVGLGWSLKEKGKLSEALNYVKRGIILNQKTAMFFFKEGIIYHDLSDKKQALKSLKKAKSIDKNSKIIQLVDNIFQKEKNFEEIKITNKIIGNTDIDDGLNSDIFISNMLVSDALIKRLYQINSRELDKGKPMNDARYGNGVCSDFELFDDSSLIIKNLKKDLINIMESTLDSKIFIYASFFNILRGISGTKPHKHLSYMDKDKSLSLSKRKYSLVYYLSVGDQNCSKPGILRLYNPNKEILPSKGKIIITPSSREHSSIYNGITDRVMVGVNFYTL